MKNKSLFSQNLRNLREKKKISQKTVSQELGISQALLSHYEKGVRECGLNFLVKAAKYYGVSADCLLGLTSDAPFSASEDGDADGEGGVRKVIKLIADETGGNTREEKNENKYNNYSILYKNLLANAIDYIFDGIADAEYRQTAKISGEYMLISAYLLCKYLTGPADTGTEFLSLEEIAAAKARLVAALKKNDKYLPGISANINNIKGKKSNGYINSVIKTGENIISRLN